MVNWATISHFINRPSFPVIQIPNQLRLPPANVQQIRTQPPPTQGLISPDQLFHSTPQSRNVLTSIPLIGLNNLDMSNQQFQSSSPPIGPGTRVLVIGDSHSVGEYGKHLDDIIRETGATVETHGSCGSQPTWWYSGQKTTCGYYSENEHGQVKRTKWHRDPAKRESHATPRINTLLERYKPDVVIVSLAANMINNNDKHIVDTTNRMADDISNSGAKVFWVGSPHGSPAQKKPEKIDRVNRIVEETVSDNGPYIDARDYMRYFGGDGRHLSGSKGKAMARLWAKGVLDEIQFGKSIATQNLRTNFNAEVESARNNGKTLFDGSFDEIFARPY